MYLIVGTLLCFEKVVNSRCEPNHRDWDWFKKRVHPDMQLSRLSCESTKVLALKES
jgi:hypothetical protein